MTLRLKHCSPYCVSVQPSLLHVKLSPKVPGSGCGISELTSASVCITCLQFKISVDGFEPGFSPTLPIGVSWGSSSAVSPTLGQLALLPTPGQFFRTQCNTLKTCIFAAVARFFGSDRGFRCYVAHIGLVLGLLRRPHTGQSCAC